MRVMRNVCKGGQCVMLSCPKLHVDISFLPMICASIVKQKKLVEYKWLQILDNQIKVQFVLIVTTSRCMNR